MQSIRIGILVGVCGVMALADAMLSLAYVRYGPKDFNSHQLWFMPLAILLLNLPYLGACGASLTPLRRRPGIHWFFIIMVGSVAALSLALRYADYSIARSAWEARLAGLRFGFNAPPPRLIAVLVDYVGVGLALALTGVIAIVSSRRSMLKTKR